MSSPSGKILRMIKRASGNYPIRVKLDRERRVFYSPDSPFEEQSYDEYRVEIDSVLDYLEEENYIVRVEKEKDTIRLKHKGLHNVQHFIGNAIWKFIVPGAVSFIVSLLVTLLSNSQ